MFWGAQAASLFFSAACRKAQRTFVARNSCSGLAFVGKLPTTTGWQPVLPRSERALSACGIARLWFRARRLETNNCLAFLHQIKPIARDCFEIRHVCLDQIDLSRLMGQQSLLFVHLLLQVVDLRPAPHQFFVGRHEEAHDHEPERNHDQNEKNPVKSLPDGSFATRAEIAVAVMHSAHCSAVHSFVTKFFFDSQQLIVFRDSITAAKRSRFDLTCVGRYRDVRNRRIFRFT